MRALPLVTTNGSNRLGIPEYLTYAELIANETATGSGDVFYVSQDTGTIFLLTKKRAGLWEDDRVSSTFEYKGFEFNSLTDDKLAILSAGDNTNQARFLIASTDGAHTHTFQGEDGTLTHLTDITNVDFEEVVSRGTTAEDPDPFDDYLPVLFTTPVIPIGRYKINPEWGWFMASSVRTAQFNVILDGSITLNPILIEREPSDASNLMVENFYRYQSFVTATTHTLQLQYRVGSGGGATPTLTVAGFIADFGRKI